MQPIVTLFEQSHASSQPVLPARLRTAYGGDLQFPTAPVPPVYVLANFVATLDGIASYQIPGKSAGGPISGFNEADRFIMGLLRSTVDAVLVGSGTLHGDPGHVRLAHLISPAFEQEFQHFRQTVLKKPVLPLNVIITGSGRIDLDEPTFHTPGLTAVIITSVPGYDRLRREHGHSLAAAVVRPTDDQDQKVSPAAAINILHDEFGVERLLHEGGPTMFGQFLAEGLVDELFLTLSPQIAGRDALHRRLGIAEQTLHSPEDSPWFELVSVKSMQSYLFLRYRSCAGEPA